MISFTLPLPPSVNHAFRNVSAAERQANPRRGIGGRTMTEAYRKWRTAAGWEINRQRVLPVPGPVVVLIEAGIDRRRDLDNCLKGLLDIMVWMHVIDDDRWVDDLRIVRGGEAGQCQVTVRRCDAADCRDAAAHGGG